MHWMVGDDEPETPAAPARPDCPGCGEPDVHGDDFCHECGHAFDHFTSGGDDDGDGEEQGIMCPSCAAGELVQLDHGRTQCDACGYMVRDEG